MRKETSAKSEIDQILLASEGKVAIGRINKVITDLEKAGEKPSRILKDRYTTGLENFKFINGPITNSLTDFTNCLGSARNESIIKLSSSAKYGYFSGKLSFVECHTEIQYSSFIVVIPGFETYVERIDFINKPENFSNNKTLGKLGKFSKKEISTKVINKIKELAKLK